ncbi:sensor histidine kinase [Streptomyces mirabilis]|uniref:sensor histidine kinase n=1 Tax=Streptomyces mirabilis TaxID=68239 RepID=UPI00332D38BD
MEREEATPKPPLFAVVGAVVFGLVAEGDLWVQHPLLTVVNLLLTTLNIIAGLVLFAEADQRVSGLALILCGVSNPLGWADQWDWGPLPLYSVLFGYISPVFGAWALIRYPDERMDRAGRVLITSLGAWTVGVPALLVCVAQPSWLTHQPIGSAWWPPVWPDERVFDLLSIVFVAGCALMGSVFLCLLIRRLLSGNRRERAVRLPVTAAGIVAAFAAIIVTTTSTFARPRDEVFAVEGIADLAVPIAFLVSVAQRRLMRLVGVVSTFTDAAPTALLLRDMLRLTMRDPDLDLFLWSEDDQSYLDMDGAKSPLPPSDVPDNAAAGEQIPITGTNGSSLAQLRTSGRITDRHIVTAAEVLTRLVLEKQQLSRRLLTAEYDARASIAADLHDGAQKELCALLAILVQCRHGNGSDRDHLVEAACDQADKALQELRDLAHGVYPHALHHAGLATAVDEVADALDLLVDLRIPDKRLPAAVEKTAYFFICEALTNVHKHAGDTTTEVTVSHADGHVDVAVRDYGHGDADPSGRGLARMRDRIQAHGGVLTLTSPHEQGTHLMMRLPCV